MAKLSSFYLIVAIISSIYSLDILPFHSIKVENDQIFVRLTGKSEAWKRLKSISNLTSEQIIGYSKQKFKGSNCPIACYMFEILKDFPKIYEALSNKELAENEYVVVE